MKSIMEEASSIIKAIEKGWQTAGKPKEFTVKIFEEPQKNFIGMTVKPAKVALIYSETPVRTESKPRRGDKTGEAVRDSRERGRQQPADRQRQPRQSQQRDQREPREQLETKRTEPPKRIIKKQDDAAAATERAERLEKLGPVWTEDMIASAQSWLGDLLAMLNVTTPFTVTPERFHLKIQFSSPVYEETKREKQLFASVSHLLLTMLKRQYKRPLKGYKIVLTGP